MLLHKKNKTERFLKQFQPVVEYDLHDAMTPLKEGGTPNNTFEKEASFSYLYIVVVGILGKAT